MKNEFTSRLMRWHREDNLREMPWKGEKNPYKIWLSEVILQQTRVEQGLSYYNNFIQKYPTITHLAKAQDEDVFKLWEGLGYYNRCKNLLHTARYITNELQSKFPDNYDSIVALKGIGPYTAAAISSFAFNLPYAVVDGNVFRVLSRFYGIDTPIDSTAGKNEFSILANKVLDKNLPGEYNQAIMDFGATVCKPQNPLCNHCPVQIDCEAYNIGQVNYLPVKEKTLLRKNRWFYYFLLEVDNKILIHKREGKDIWQNLFEFYLIESKEQLHLDDDAIADLLQEQLGIKKLQVLQISALQSQQLTHQTIKGKFIHVKLSAVPNTLKLYQLQPINKLKEQAFPKFINQFLETWSKK